MPTQEVSSTNWQAFCDKFTELHRSSIISISTLDWAGRETEVARSLPLKSMELDKSGDCNDVIRIEAGEAPHTPICHSIVEPIHLKVQEDTNGGKVLRIQAETGTTLIHFSSGKIDQLLEELQ